MLMKAGKILHEHVKDASEKAFKPGRNAALKDNMVIANYHYGDPNQQYVFDAESRTTYLKGRLLGKGGFAKCYEMTDVSSRKVYAGKVISKHRLLKPHQKDKIIREIELHRNLVHPNVVRFVSYFEDDMYVYIILENCSRKSLVHVLKNRKVLTEPEVRFYIRQLTEGTVYLHQERIVHRDLKLGNMLLNDTMQVKIADFGLATRIEYEGEKKMTVCGTPNYIAPEVLQRKGHTYPSDIWAIGCVMYALLVGRPPFETSTLKETYSRITANKFHVPSSVSKPARHLIQRLLHPDADQRPSLERILAHEFFSAGHNPRTLPVACWDTVPKWPSENSKSNKKENTPPRPKSYAAPVTPAEAMQKITSSLSHLKNSKKSSSQILVQVPNTNNEAQVPPEATDMGVLPITPPDSIHTSRGSQRVPRNRSADTGRKSSEPSRVSATSGSPPYSRQTSTEQTQSKQLISQPSSVAPQPLSRSHHKLSLTGTGAETNAATTNAYVALGTTNSYMSPAPTATGSYVPPATISHGSTQGSGDGPTPRRARDRASHVRRTPQTRNKSSGMDVSGPKASAQDFSRLKPSAQDLETNNNAHVLSPVPQVNGYHAGSVPAPPPHVSPREVSSVSTPPPQQVTPPAATPGRAMLVPPGSQSNPAPPVPPKGNRSGSGRSDREQKQQQHVDHSRGTCPSAIRLYQLLGTCIEQMPADSNPSPLPQTNPLWVTKWVDYSNKYGFGFQLSDRSVGVLFNDTTRMLLAPDGRTIQYNDLSNKIFTFSKDNAPHEHHKKTTLLIYFSQYMGEHLIHGGDLIHPGGGRSRAGVVSALRGPAIFMKKWFRTQRAIVMYLNNGTLQVNFFEDHTKVIISPDGQDYTVTYINHQRQSVSYRLLQFRHFGCNADILDRLQYSRQMLESIINIEGERV